MLGCSLAALLPVAAAAQIYKKIYDFSATSTGGAPATVSQPVGAPVRLPSGNFYGVSYFGGPAACTASSSPCGTFFELKPPSAIANDEPWTETTLYEFSAGIDGTAGNATPLYVDGVFYGTTYGGGCPSKNECNGTVYSMIVDKSGQHATKTIIHSFQGGTDGSRPTFLAILNNNLYGITNFGGSTNAGIVYELSTPGSGAPLAETVIHTFDGAGEGSYAQYIVAYNGELYVSLAYNGAYQGGTIVKLTPPAPGSTTWATTIVFSFGGPESIAWNPEGITVGPDGFIYGAAQLGGGGACTSVAGKYPGCGAVFQLQPSASSTSWTFKQIYAFQDGADSGSPFAPPIFDTSGNIFVSSTGTLISPKSYGAILRLSAQISGDFNSAVVHTFTPADAVDPAGSLTLGPTGVMYGFATYGGLGNNGAAFSLTPSPK